MWVRLGETDRGYGFPADSTAAIALVTADVTVTFDVTAGVCTAVPTVLLLMLF